MAELLFKKVAFIGIGLIGSSMARRMARDGLAEEFVACARSEQTRAKALELGIVSSAFTDPAEAAAHADLVVIATPLGSYGPIAEAIAHSLKPGAIVTDVGSVKQSVVEGGRTPYSQGCAFCSRSSHCGHRTLRARSRISGTV